MRTPRLRASTFIGMLSLFVFTACGSASASENKLSWPLERAAHRPTPLSFGLYVTPDSAENPIDPPERFTGYHVGTDFEIMPDEEDVDISVYAICSGEAIYSGFAEGYGGLIVQRCVIDDEPVVVLYGHLALDPLPSVKGKLHAGRMIGKLAPAHSHGSDDNRKHLHLGIVKGTEISYLGYVQTADELQDFMDPKRFSVDGACLHRRHGSPCISAAVFLSDTCSCFVLRHESGKLVRPAVDAFFLPVWFIDDNERRKKERTVVVPLEPQEVFCAPRSEVVAVIAEAHERHRFLSEIDVFCTLFEKVIHVHVELPLGAAGVPRTGAENQDVSAKKIVWLCELSFLHFDDDIRHHCPELRCDNVSDKFGVATRGCGNEMERAEHRSVRMQGECTGGYYSLYESSVFLLRSRDVASLFRHHNSKGSTTDEKWSDVHGQSVIS